jgi:hypothetical protein
LGLTMRYRLLGILSITNCPRRTHLYGPGTITSRVYGLQQEAAAEEEQHQLPLVQIISQHQGSCEEGGCACEMIALSATNLSRVILHLAAHDAGRLQLFAPEQNVHCGWPIALSESERAEHEATRAPSRRRLAQTSSKTNHATTALMSRIMPTL